MISNASVRFTRATVFKNNLYIAADYYNGSYYFCVFKYSLDGTLLSFRVWSGENFTAAVLNDILGTPYGLFASGTWGNDTFFGGGILLKVSSVRLLRPHNCKRK